MAPVLGGEALSFGDRRQIDAALATAERVSGLSFQTYLGPAADQTRQHAIALHAKLTDPDGSVLVLCDPERRVLEIVTGQRVRTLLDDGACRLAVATMTSSFLAGDLVGGLINGIQQLGEAAYHPQMLHASGRL
ncbi:MAG: DUF5130 domain-containing protein [Microlunatus sp.]|nr:DUF5130 domain-containing protein [Microlunatus sp.]MDN5769623.1 DUF5130 domain-containing protein [Microlunatus sp.]